MARSLLAGFEMGSVGEGYLNTGGALSSSVFRSGAYSYKFTNDASYITFASIAAGGSARSFCRSVRMYLRIDALPPGPSSAMHLVEKAATSGGAPKAFIAISNTGVLSCIDDNGTNSFNSGALVWSSDSLWHRIEWDCGYNSGAGARIYVDGSLWASNASGTYAAQPFVRLGGQGSGGVTIDAYIDDVIVDDASFNTSGFPGAGNVILLIPTAGDNANSWTGGAGGTGNISVGVDNIPPTGDATPADADQIKNAASGGNLDYTATMQSYTVGGVPAGATINAVMAICNDAEEVGTNTKAGGIWIASNPAQGAGGNSFDFGDDVGAFGTFPSNWSTHCGPVTAAPSVTPGTAPTITVRKTSSTTRVVDVDFMGLYVDYTSSAAFMPRPPLVVGQAIKRASLY